MLKRFCSLGLGGLLLFVSGLVLGANHHSEVMSLCQQIGKKLASVTVAECLSNPYSAPRFYSVQGKAILEAHFPASPENKSAPRILFIGGIHGDEYSSVSVTFKWLNKLRKHHSGAFDWHFLPVLNPDGLLQRKSSRVNANKVDLNRNFIPAPEFSEPLEHWQKRAKKRLRYYPGHKPLSEPESRVIHDLIDQYRPTVIVSVHAPHGILDFDGGIQPPRKLGPLHLRQLGTYPGSLGNYGWFVKNIPVVTIELPYAGIMPSKRDINRMWTDLVRWLKYKSQRKKSELAATKRLDEN